MRKSALEVGVDVPWVTSWTEETIIGVRPCPTVNGDLAICQTENARYGRPEYSKNHLVRQRLSIRRMLCPMCGQPTREDDRWTQVAKRIPAGLLRRGRIPDFPRRITDDQIVVDAGSIAPLHLACSERSLQHCPHLRADPNVNVMRFPKRWTMTPLTTRATLPAAPVNVLVAPVEAPAAFPVVMFIQLFGLTDDTDKDWRRRAKFYDPRVAPA